MVTILLEVKRDSRNEFYNPAPKDFRKKPRADKCYCLVIKARQ
jgi:hypothetical protein